MISVDAFFSSTLATVDSVLNNFVGTAYSNIINANLELITLSFTLYIMILGYKFLTHTQVASLGNIMQHLIVMLCVYGLVMRWDLYNIFIYNIFTNEPGRIAQVLVQASGHAHESVSVVKALDGVYDTIISASLGFFSQVNFSSSGVAFGIYGVLVFCIGTVMCAIALLLFIYSKMMMAVALALGPLFLLLLLWESTRDMFSAWLRKLLMLAMIPVVTSAILMLMLSVINVTLPNIKQLPENMQFYGIAPFLGLSLTTALILSQVLSICSSLSGGLSLSSLSKGVEIAKSSLEHSGLTAAGRRASDWSRKTISKPVSHIRRSIMR